LGGSGAAAPGCASRARLAGHRTPSGVLQPAEVLDQADRGAAALEAADHHQRHPRLAAMSGPKVSAVLPSHCCPAP
jgi:hypothetical protein